MNIKNVERKANTVTITLEIDKDLVESGMDQAYRKQRKSIQIPGFRKGKASRKMVEAMYGAHVFLEDGLEEIFHQVYDFAVKDQDFRAIGSPKVEDIKVEEDGSVTMGIVTDIYPEVTLGQYKGLEVEKLEVSVSDAQVQSELDRMARNVASAEAVEDRPAAMGDTANIDFLGLEDGDPFDGGEGSDYDLELGSGQFIPGFEEQVVGMNPGEEKEIALTFPEDYHDVNMAGKAVTFQVTLNSLSVTSVPEQDDEFAKDVSEFDTLEELKADIRAKALEKAQKEADSEFEERAVVLATANTTVELPETLIENEIDSMIDRMGYQMQMYGTSLDAYARMMGTNLSGIRRSFRPSAEEQARISVTLEQIVKEEGFTVTDEEMEAEYQRLAQQYEMELEKVKKVVTTEEVTDTLNVQKARRLIADSAVAVTPKLQKEAEAPEQEAESAPQETESAPQETEPAPQEAEPASQEAQSAE